MTADKKVLLWGGFYGRFVPVCLIALMLFAFYACAADAQFDSSGDNEYDDSEHEYDGDVTQNIPTDDGDVDSETDNLQENSDFVFMNGPDDLPETAGGNVDIINENHDDPCILAENRLGYLACRTTISNGGEYYQLSLADGVDAEIERASKYIIPAGQEAPLPGMIQNVNRFDLHYEFLKTVFPELYAALSIDQYENLVLNADTRQYFAGALIKLKEECNGASYGFTVYQNTSQSLLGKLEISYIQKSISAMMHGNRILYFPMSSAEENAISSWAKSSDDISVYNCGTPVEYEVYTAGTAYGYVRILTLSEFEEAGAEGLLGWQDIIVLEGTPFNILFPAAAIVTGERQNVLSHINVQASVRGTPNIYVRDPFEAFAIHEGQLVRIDADTGGYKINTEITAEEAQEWWEEHRPQLENVVEPDYSFTAMPELDEVAVADATQRKTAFSRFGGKGANLAILSSIIDHQYMVDGFLVPFRHFQKFMDSNSLPLYGGQNSENVSYTDYMNFWVNNDEFLLSSAKRREVLNRLVDHIINSSRLDNDLIVNIAARIKAVFGSENVMVRMRSSSNMEDSIEFSGAGLYESYSACAADSFGGIPDASKCDADKNRQMTIQSALRKVWASFWKPQAFEERFYFQYYSPEDTAMAIAVTPAFNDESVNGVVFTGLPNSPGDKRMLVNAQIGEVSVVSPPQGVLPETAIIDTDRDTASVVRIQDSSLVTFPATVLSDAEYLQMGAILDDVRSRYPIDAEGYAENSIILDLEFKYTPERKLLFKQSRAFLIKTEESGESNNGFRFEVEQDSVLCGQFMDFREPAEEYSLKAAVHLKPQQLVLPVEGEINIELIDSISFGPQQIQLYAESAPQWQRQSAEQNGKTTYKFYYCNSFAGSGIQAEICWQTSGYELAGSYTPAKIVINEDQISNLRNNWSMTVSEAGKDNDIRLSSCSYDKFTSYRRTAVLAGGEKITMDVKAYPSIIGSYNAALVSVTYEDGEFIYADNDYFRLVYAAEHHNLREKLMFVFDHPISGIGGYIFEEPYAGESGQVRVIELDESLEVAEYGEISSYSVEVIP